MLSIGFSLMCGLLIYICYYVSHDMINVISVFTVPYMLIIPINNLFMVRNGFYLISSQTICLIGSALLCIFTGYIIANVITKTHKRNNREREQAIENMFIHYNIQKMLKYTFIVEAIAFLRLIITIIKNGIVYISTESFAGYMVSGPIGHLLLTIYPLVPILFLYWLKNKRKVAYLVSTVICILLLFTTFVKYHVIGMMVLIFLFVSLEDKRYIRKGLIIVSAVAMSAFVLNYFVSFVLRGTAANIAQDYYFNHLWNYMAGSLIYDNRIFTTGIRVDTTIFYKLGTALFAVPNAFLSAMFNIRIIPHVALPPLPVASNGQYGNVVDAFGYYFPSKGSPIEIAFYFVFMIFIGFIFTWIYQAAMSQRSTFKVPLCVFLTFYIFFSFFGTFYNMLPPWEILGWSLIILPIFDRRIRIKIGKYTLISK